MCDFPPQENSIKNLPAAPAPTTKTLFLFVSFPSFALLISLFLFEIGSIGSVSFAARCGIDVSMESNRRGYVDQIIGR